MLSRALTTATVMLLVGGFASMPVRAENLEAGKSPSQIFTGTCLACHKGMRGLIKTVTPGSLPGFLRQHYTTSPEMAGQLSAYLLSNGAVDTRLGSGKQSKDARSDSKPDLKSDLKPEPKPEPKPVLAPERPEPRLGHRRRSPRQEAEKPDTDGAAVQGEHQHEPNEPAARSPRNVKRLARPGPEAPEADRPTSESQPGAAVGGELGPGGRPAKKKLGRRGRPRREELPKEDAARTDAVKTGADRTSPGIEEPPSGQGASAEPSKNGAVKSDTTRTEAGTAEGRMPEASKGDAKGSEPILRADPAPAATSAVKSTDGEARPAQTAAPSAGATASVTSGSGSISGPPAASAPATGPTAPSIDAPATPAGPSEPPTPPISR